MIPEPEFETTTEIVEVSDTKTSAAKHNRIDEVAPGIFNIFNIVKFAGRYQGFSCFRYQVFMLASMFHWCQFACELARWRSVNVVKVASVFCNKLYRVTLIKLEWVIWLRLFIHSDNIKTSQAKTIACPPCLAIGIK